MSPQPYLWYGAGELNFNPSFNDFVPFGGWKAPVVKQIYGNVTVPLLCGTKDWHAFIDYIWNP